MIFFPVTFLPKCLCSCCVCLQVAQAHGTLPPQQPQQPPERLFGPAARATVAAQWNGLVDDTLGRLAQELGKRGI
jgi:hypothetical protein